MQGVLEKLTSWQSSAADLEPCFLQGDEVLACWREELDELLEKIELLSLLFLDCIKVRVCVCVYACARVCVCVSK